MALLAPQDWQPPRDHHTMDVPSPTPTVPRQRSSPANDHSPSQSPPITPQQQSQPQSQQSQQPYPYPVQQPQGGWTPSIAAQPFYPSFYPNQTQQPPYNAHGQQPHTPPGQLPQQNPYFDPAANAQLAQWAYQQMMFNAQQAHQLQHMPRNGPAPTPDYFAQNQLAGFSPFPTGTPPPVPPQNQLANNFGQHRSNSADQQQYGGFHPYRRPNNRQGSQQSQDSDWRAGPFQPPYGRTDAASSSTSVNSQSSYGKGAASIGAPTGRPRTNSNQTSSSNGQTNGSIHSGSVRSRGATPQSDGSRSRTGSNSSSSSNQQARPIPHHRNASSSSSVSSSTTAPRPSIASTTSAVTTSSTSSSHTNTKARPARPSPLSQGNFTAAEKRMSRDDSDIAAMMESSPNASALRSGGIKGRLRRALSLNASQTLSEEKANEEEEDDDDASIKATSSGRIHPSSSTTASSSSSKAPVSRPLPGVADDAESTATVQTKKKSRAASLFNSRLNASTDNISLSSTVSSASVMIRKLGSMGNLARRNSLAGITSLFKDKKNKEGGDETGGNKKDKKKKKSAKGDAAEASVSHVTAELDRSNDWNVGTGEMTGLSPAAKLARQHTLKSNAEAAARAKALQESMAAAAAAQKQGVNGAPLPETWEKNTATRHEKSPAKAGGRARVNEDGTRVFVEEDDSGSESGDGTYDGHQQHSIAEGWDDDEDWADGAEDQDVTIRVGLERTNIGEEGEETEEWGPNVRRSMERVRVPKKGILKHAATYDQQSYLADLDNPRINRARANSDNSHPTQNSELGPLARIPSPDPDHIDGLSRHPSHSSQHAKSNASTAPTAPFLPALSFETSGGLGMDSPKDMDSGRSSPAPTEKAIFSHPSFNSSAPTLSTMTNPTPPTLTHRSATAPSKRLVFANNLSVYDTFSASVYDRRSEPATWSRLTPALAQRIKEELNSYKMEEMEVHAASRIHTQFFV